MRLDKEQVVHRAIEIANDTSIDSSVKMFMLIGELNSSKYTIDESSNQGEAAIPKQIDEWHEDYGDVLWWTFPIEEPPYVGSPLADDWPGYHTHWTDIIEPKNPGITDGGEDS